MSAFFAAAVRQTLSSRPTPDAALDFIALCDSWELSIDDGLTTSRAHLQHFADHEKLDLLEGVLSMLTQSAIECVSSPNLRDAQDKWSYGIRDDYRHARSFNLPPSEMERLLDWMADQRDYLRLCQLHAQAGIEDPDFVAHEQARSDRSLLRGRPQCSRNSARAEAMRHRHPDGSNFAVSILDTNDETSNDFEDLFLAAEISSQGLESDQDERRLPAVLEADLEGDPEVITVEIDDVSENLPVPYLPLPGSNSCITYEAAFSRYMNDYAKPYCKDAPQVQARYRRYISSVFRQRQLTEITRQQIQRLHARLGSDVGETTANRAVEDIQRVFNKMAEWDLFTGKNPAKGVKKFKLKSRERFLQPEEKDRFFTAVEQLPSKTARDFFLLALFTGVRKSNLLEMRWEEINWNRATWTIPKTKNGKPHTVPLLEPAVAILKDRKADTTFESPYVFPSDRGAQGHFVNPYKTWLKLRKQAGMEDLRLHDLRRSLGSWMAINGTSLNIIGAALGHSSTKSTEVYARLNQAPVRSAMDHAVSSMLKPGAHDPGGD